jgi:hypothetical protein
MYPRTDYEMSEEQLVKLIDACKPVPYMVIGGVEPRSPQENANDAWRALGKEMGFDHMSVRPIDGKPPRFFTAIPSETESQRVEREAATCEQNRLNIIEGLKSEIAERQKMLDKLIAAVPK